MSWVLWAALQGYDGAAVALAQGLTQRAREMGVAAPRAVETDGHAAGSSEVDAVERTALAWLRRVRSSILDDFHHWLQALDLGADDEDREDHQNEDSKPVPAPADASPTLQETPSPGAPASES